MIGGRRIKKNIVGGNVSSDCQKQTVTSENEISMVSDIMKLSRLSDKEQLCAISGFTYLTTDLSTSYQLLLLAKTISQNYTHCKIIWSAIPTFTSY